MTYKYKSMQLPEFVWAGAGFVVVGLWRVVLFFLNEKREKIDSNSSRFDEIKEAINSSEDKIQVSIHNVSMEVSQLKTTVDNLEKNTDKDLARIEAIVGGTRKEVTINTKEIANVSREIAVIKEWKKNIANK